MFVHQRQVRAHSPKFIVTPQSIAFTILSDVSNLIDHHHFLIFSPHPHRLSTLLSSLSLFTQSFCLSLSFPLHPHPHLSPSSTYHRVLDSFISLSSDLASVQTVNSKTNSKTRTKVIPESNPDISLSTMDLNLTEGKFSSGGVNENEEPSIMKDIYWRYVQCIMCVRTMIISTFFL